MSVSLSMRMAILFMIFCSFVLGWVGSYFSMVADSPILPVACLVGMILSMWAVDRVLD